MLRFHIIILCVGIIVRLFVPPTRTMHRHVVTHKSRVHVITSCDIKSGWRDHVTNILTTAQIPINLSILLECSGLDAVDEHNASDSILSTAAHVEYGIKRSQHPNVWLRRLTKRFVTGNEAVVMFVYPGLWMLPGWGLAATQVHVEDGVVSLPSVSSDGRPRFPSLRKRSTGSTARDSSICFEANETICTTPSVCWCPETTMMRGSTAALWSKMVTKSFVEQTLQRPHSVANARLVGHSPTVEDYIIDFDEGYDRLTLRLCERAGLTERASGEERVCKYGSVFRARLAVETKQDDA